MGKKSNFTGRSIPSLSTRKSAPVTTNFARGIYTYKPNDTMDSTEVRLAQDARFDRVGEYGTRPGYKQLTGVLGRAQLYNNGASPYVTRALSQGIDPVTCTAESDGVLCSAKIYVFKRNNRGDYSIGRLTVFINGKQVTQACFKNTSWQAVDDVDVFFNDAPSYKSGDVIKVVMDVQSGKPETLGVQCNNNSTTPRTVLYTCPAGPVRAVFEANIDGARSILFVYNHNLYFYPNSNGSVTNIRTLPADVEKIRFSQNLNTVRYTDGKEGIRLLTPTITDGAVTGWTDTSIAAKDLKTDTTLTFRPRNIMNGTADNLVYMVNDPDTEAIWTYPYGYTYAKSPAFTTTATISGDVGTTLSFAKSTITPSGYAVGDWITGQGTATGEITTIGSTNVTVRIVDTTPQSISSYDKFSTDFYQNFPAIKTGDPLTAMFNLGGVLYFMTRRNKYQMYAQTADSWSQSNTNAQNGTFSQESIVCDLNYAYFANDNGIYIFDGASEASITEGSIQNVYDAIPNKEQIVVDLYKNRLYVFYPSTADGPNDHCLVYNINLHVWESFDSNTYVSATSARQNSSNRFICGHSKIGMLMIAEDTNNNDYSDLGAPIAFNLETSYQHFGTTSQQKRITKWRPQFATTTNPYTVECGYSLDYTDQVRYAFSIDLQRQVPVWIGKNQFNPATITTGAYLSDAGAVTTNADYCYSDYIPILPSTPYTTSGWANSGLNPARCYYSADKTYLSGVKHNAQSVFTNTSPANACYMRESVTIADINKVQVEAGSSATAYEPYKNVWTAPDDYGVPAIPTRHTTIPKVNGEFYRCQIRYQHIAAFEPVIFRSHTLTIETQRIR